jgi:hypothetical protein
MMPPTATTAAKLNINFFPIVIPAFIKLSWCCGRRTVAANGKARRTHIFTDRPFPLLP